MFQPVISRVIDLLRPYQFRGKHRLLAPFASASGTVEADVFGARMMLDLSDFIQRSIYMGTFERNETRAVKRHLGKGMCFVDVGANAGYFTALAASLVGVSGAIYSYEPSHTAFAWLMDLIHRNQWANVRAINCGLSDEESLRDLYLGEAGNHTPTMVPHGQRSIGRFEVRMLDKELSRLGLRKVDLMKIDVEGFEPNVVAGAREALRSGAIRTVLAEFNSHWLERNGSSADALGKSFEELGFGLQESFGLNRLYRHKADR